MEFIKLFFIRHGLLLLFVASVLFVAGGVGLFFFSHVWDFHSLVVGVTRAGSYVLGSSRVPVGIGFMGLVFVAINGFVMWGLASRSRFLAFFVGWGSFFVALLIFSYFVGIVSLQ